MTAAPAPSTQMAAPASTAAVLPAGFADLEPFADWALPLEGQRYAKRLASSMDELQDFYDAAFARLDDALTSIDRHPLDALPDEAQRLLWLYCSLVTITFPIEVWRQPRVPDAGASSIDCVVEFPT